MILKKKILGAATLLAISSLGLYSFTNKGKITDKTDVVLNDGKGKELFEEKCTKCHRTTPPKTKAERQEMKAPPIMGVMFHVNDGIKAENEKEKKEKVINFIVDYAHNPSAEKSFCEKHAIERFGVMPSQKGNVTVEELKEIANYLYNAYPSKNVSHEELQKQMHGEENHKGKGKKSCKKH